MKTLLASILLVSACGSTTISASDYRRDCAADTDCAVLYVGDLCSCSCESAGINVADRARANADRASISCDTDCGPCQTAEAYCSQGTCATRLAP